MRAGAKRIAVATSVASTDFAVDEVGVMCGSMCSVRSAWAAVSESCASSKAEELDPVRARRPRPCKEGHLVCLNSRNRSER
jgi:hypothetical protein